MSYLAAILILMTVLLASISCGGGAPDIRACHRAAAGDHRQPRSRYSIRSFTTCPASSGNGIPTLGHRQRPARHERRRSQRTLPGSLRHRRTSPRETPTATGMEESTPEAYAKTTPVHLATPAPRSERGDRPGHVRRHNERLCHGLGRKPLLRDGKGRRPLLRNGKARQPAPSHRKARQTGPSGLQADLKAGEVDDNQRWNEYLQFVAGLRGPPGPPHQPGGPADNHRPGPERKSRAQRPRHRKRQREGTGGVPHIRRRPDPPLPGCHPRPANLQERREKANSASARKETASPRKGALSSGKARPTPSRWTER